MKTTAIVITALALTACDYRTEAPRPDPELGSGGAASSTGKYSPGNRLKVRVLSAEDDSLEQLGWFDGQLGMSCTFRQSGEDCAMRCVPDCEFDAAPMYLDAACTQPVYVYSPDPSKCGDYVTGLDGTAGHCDSYAGDRQLFHVTAQTVRWNSLFASQPGGDCAPVSPQSADPSYRVVEEEPETMLVRAAEVVLP